MLQITLSLLLPSEQSFAAHYSTGVSIAGLKTMAKGNLRREGQERQERKQRPRKTAALWLALCSLLSLISYTTRAPAQEWHPTHSGLGPPTTITNQENAPHVGNNLMGASIQSKFPVSLSLQARIKLKKSNQYSLLYTRPINQLCDHQVNPSKWRNKALIIFQILTQQSTSVNANVLLYSGLKVSEGYSS